MEIALRPQLLIIEMNWNNLISRKITGNNMNGTKKKQMKFKKINNLYSRQKIIARFQFIITTILDKINLFKKEEKRNSISIKMHSDEKINK